MLIDGDEDGRGRMARHQAAKGPRAVGVVPGIISVVKTHRRAGPRPRSKAGHRACIMATGRRIASAVFRGLLIL